MRRVRRIDLAPLKQRLGGNWPRFEQAVFRIALRIARRIADPDDVVRRQGLTIRLDTGAQDLQADDLAARITLDIWRAFVGRDVETPARPEERPSDRPAGLGRGGDVAVNGAGPVARSPKMFDRALETAVSGRQPPAAAGSGWLESQFEVQFRPWWAPALARLYLYQAVPMRHVEDGLLIGGQAIDAQWGGALQIAATRRLVTDSLAEFDALNARNDAAYLVIPIQFAVLESDEDRSWLVRQLAWRRAASAQRIALDIVGLPLRQGDGRAARWIAELASHVKVVAARLPVETSDLGLFKALRVYNVGASLLGVEGDEAATIRKLRRFQSLAATQGLRCSITDLPSRSLILAAATAGFDFVQGAGIGRIGQTGLLPPSEFAFCDLFALETVAGHAQTL